MDVILLERIEKLGQMGDVVSVKPGFARNYLLPQGRALRATDGNRAQFDQQRAQLEAENLERKSEAEAVAAKMEGLTVVLIRQAGDAGQLYGSVSARDVADAVTSGGVTIKRSQVVLEKPIKTIGLHSVRVELHGEVIVLVTANVARSKDEAETQEKTGAAVLSIAEQEQMEIRAEAETFFDEGTGEAAEDLEGVEAVEGDATESVETAEEEPVT